MRYLPELVENKQYVERDFLFAIVNTIDVNYFREALAELEIRRASKAHQEAESMVEIDKNLFGLLEQMQSRLSAQKQVSSKRTMRSLTGLFSKRKAPVR